jgi:MHS family proline/betaine transporter-like MFS transporter
VSEELGLGTGGVGVERLVVPTALGNSRLYRSAGLILLAYTIEFYDYVLYGVFASIVGRQFFPSSDPELEFLGAAGAFAAGFIARPVGGVLSGLLADRLGRRRVLALNLCLMALGSAGIAVVPPFAWIGITAPVLVVLFRLIQGFAAAGNGTSALTLLVEHGGRHRRGLFGSLGQTGSFLGTLAGASVGMLLSTTLSASEMGDWGWRVAFLGGVLVGPLAYIVSHKVEETLSISVDVGRTQHPPSNQNRPRINDDLGKLLWTSLIISGGIMAAYFTLFYMPGYGSTVLHLPSIVGFRAVVVACVFGIASGLLAGAFSDRVGRRPILIAAQIGFLVVMPISLIFLAFDQSGTAILIAITLMATTFSPQVCISQIWMSELYPKRIRGTGVGIASNAGAILGGLVPFAATWLTRATGGLAASACVIAAGIILSLIASTRLADSGAFEEVDSA